MGGGVQEDLAAQMKRDGIAVPENLATQPLLQADLICYLEAFYDLDTERNHGWNLARIPWSRIVKYGLHYGYDIEELLFFIRKMDDAHLEHLRNNNGGASGTREMVHRPPRPD